MGSLSIASLQFSDDAVTHVNLIVKVLTLQLIQLEIECRRDEWIDAIHRCKVEDWAVERTYDVESYVCGILWRRLDMDPLQDVINYVTRMADTLYHLI